MPSGAGASGLGAQRGIAGGVTKQSGIRPELKPQVERWLKNFQEVKARLEAMCETNHAFLRPEP